MILTWSRNKRTMHTRTISMLSISLLPFTASFHVRIQSLIFWSYSLAKEFPTSVLSYNMISVKGTPLCIDRTMTWHNISWHRHMQGRRSPESIMCTSKLGWGNAIYRDIKGKVHGHTCLVKYVKSVSWLLLPLKYKWDRIPHSLPNPSGSNYVKVSNCNLHFQLQLVSILLHDKK